MKKTLEAFDPNYTTRKQTVTVAPGKYTDADIAQLVKLVNSRTTLTILVLHNCQLTAKQIGTLSELKHVSKLTLTGNNKCTRAALVKVLENVPLVQLKILPGNAGLTISDIYAAVAKSTTLVTCQRGRAGNTKEAGLLTKHLQKNKMLARIDIKPGEVKKLQNAEPAANLQALEQLTSDERENKLKDKLLAEPHYAVYKDHVKRDPRIKEKLADENWHMLMACLYYDTSSKTELDQQFLLCVISVLQFYLHNSAHCPLQGYGKARDDERGSNLTYFRSQGGSTHEGIARVFSATPVTLNSTACTLLADHTTDSNEALGTILQNVSDEGHLPQGQCKDLGLHIAYGGLRTNNVKTLETSLEEVDDAAILRQRLLQMLPSYARKAAADIKHKKNFTQNRLERVIQEITEVSHTFNDTTVKTSVLELCFSDPIKHAEHIVTKTTDVVHVKITHPPFSNHLFLEPFPALAETIRDSDNFQEGFLNTILAFVAALINHKASLAGLASRFDRRQSFGSNYPTITDCGKRIRLSMGYESEAFAEVIIAALHEFDTILSKIDLAKGKPAIIKSCLTPSERGKRVQKTAQTGNHFLSAMRDDWAKWFAIYEAEQHLAESDTPWDAFEQYCEQYIYQRVRQEIVCTSKTVTPDTFFGGIRHAEQPTLITAKNPTNQFIVSALTRTAQALHAWLKHWLPLLDVTELTNRCLLTHVLEKLQRYLRKADLLLNASNKTAVTALQQKKILQDLLEYWIVLDGCFAVHHDAYQEIDFAETLHKLEQDYFTASLQCHPTAVSAYFTDSGQQALALGLDQLDLLVHARRNGKVQPHFEQNIYLFDAAYYELRNYLEKTLKQRTTDKSHANQVVIDVTQLAAFKLKQFPLLRGLIIDITNNFDLERNPLIGDVIKACANQNIWVVMVSSNIKHSELGLDKYQSGKIVVIDPQLAYCDEDSEKLPRPMQLDVLEDIDTRALNRPTAFYLTQMHHIYRGKKQRPMSDDEEAETSIYQYVT